MLMKSLKGVATLPTVLLLGIIALSVAVSLATVTFSESFISQSATQSSKALYYGEAGARDALIKLARNKDYLCTSTDCYQVAFANSGCGSPVTACAKVQVTATTSSCGTGVNILSKGIVYNSSRSISVNVCFDSSGYGELATTTWAEITN